MIYRDWLVKKLSAEPKECAEFIRAAATKYAKDLNDAVFFMAVHSVWRALSKKTAFNLCHYLSHIQLKCFSCGEEVNFSSMIGNKLTIYPFPCGKCEAILNEC
jgi:hypothetical protein